MYKLQEHFENALREMVEDESSKESAERLAAEISGMVPGLIESLATNMMEAIQEDAEAGLWERRQDRRRFEKRHRRLWRKPLQTLELFITLATEAGADFNSEFREEYSRSGDALFEALTRLHSRACQVAAEILVMLRAGFADGAHARWRSLHEIAVVSFFLRQHGRELAERYLLHDAVQRYRSACQYQKYAAQLGYEPFSDEEFSRIKSLRDTLIERFGKTFESDFGWASAALGITQPTMTAIEEHVRMNHMRPYYRMASDNIHPNSHGNYYRLGLDPHAPEVLLAGPSNFGLADPGHSTAISLHQVTTALLATRIDLDCVAVIKTLEKLKDEVGDAFIAVHRQLELAATEQ